MTDIQQNFTYIQGVKKAAVTALRATLPKDHNADYSLDDLHIGIEYPMIQEKYPYILVSYKPSKLQSSDFNRAVGSDGKKRWVFAGSLDFELFALSAGEADAMQDGLVAALAFSDDFKHNIEGNKFIAMDVNTDKLGYGPNSVSPGTPWDDESLVYYSSYSVSCQGEFTTDPTTLAILERVDIYTRFDGEQDSHANGEWV